MSSQETLSREPLICLMLPRVDVTGEEKVARNRDKFLLDISCCRCCSPTNYHLESSWKELFTLKKYRKEDATEESSPFVDK